MRQCFLIALTAERTQSEIQEFPKTKNEIIMILFMCDVYGNKNVNSSRSKKPLNLDCITKYVLKLF